MKFVIDTNILIDKLRGGEKFDLFLEKLDKDSELYLPSIVFFELFSGISSKKEDITNYILSLKKLFHLVDMTLEIAKRAGEINRDMAENLEAPDYIIAATAIEIGAQVVTLNKKHFSQIPQVVVCSF